MNLNNLIEISQQRLLSVAKQYIKSAHSQSLSDAMYYSVLNGGKRLRPLLVYATGQALGESLEQLDAPACAVELIHAYSLIHDDLPAMDNSDLRRGQPSCHKAFNEGLAILAGDALQPLAFEVISSHPCRLNSNQRIEMIQILSHAIGAEGMCAGQALDLQMQENLELIYRLKTGALLNACVTLGAIAANAPTPTISALTHFANNLGLAFQIQDDLLDFESTQTTGKPHALDIQNNKKTFPILFGKEHAKQQIETLFSNAIEAIKNLHNGSLLNEFAFYLMQRQF